MRKKVTIAVVVALVLALSVPVAFAALNSDQQKELKGLYGQMLLTKQQGDLALKNLEARKDYLDKNGLDGQYGSGYGPGCGPGAGYGRGMMGGWFSRHFF